MPGPAEGNFMSKPNDRSDEARSQVEGEAVLPPSDASLLSLIADQIVQSSEPAGNEIIAEASKRLSTPFANNIRSAMELLATGREGSDLDSTSTRVARRLLAFRHT